MRRCSASGTRLNSYLRIGNYTIYLYFAGINPRVNKRTATLAALTLIELNGREFIAKPGELEDFAVRVAVEQLDIDTVAAWLSSHSTQRT